MARAWFIFNNATTGSPAPDLDPANFDVLSPFTETCTNGGELCAIYAYYIYDPSGPVPTPNPATPLSSNIQSYIVASRTANVPQPQAGKRYVYKKVPL